MEKKRGRPRSDAVRDKQYRLCMSEEEYDELNYMSYKSGLSRADVIREALRMYSNLLNSKN